MRSIVCNPQLVAVCNQSERNTPAVMPYTLRVITYAYRRLHTNPSDWIKKERSENFVLFLEAPTGFEPVITILQTVALPLGYGADI